jgi:hypothetical protein
MCLIVQNRLACGHTYGRKLNRCIRFVPFNDKHHQAFNMTGNFTFAKEAEGGHLCTFTKSDKAEPTIIGFSCEVPEIVEVNFNIPDVICYDCHQKDNRSVRRIPKVLLLEDDVASVEDRDIPGILLPDGKIIVRSEK